MNKPSYSLKMTQETFQLQGTHENQLEIYYVRAIPSNPTLAKKFYRKDDEEHAQSNI